MPVPSIFAWCGAIDCSGNPTHIEVFYNLLQTLWGDEIDFSEVGSDEELQCYATAVVMGSALYQAEHAGNQAFAARAYDLIPLLEQDYGLTPGPAATVRSRQAAIAAAMKLPGGATPSNVWNTIKAILGAGNALAYLPSPTFPTPTIYPAAPGAGPGQFRDTRTVPRFVQLVDPVSVTGAPLWCAYQNLDTTITVPDLLFQGDQIVVSAGNTSVMEPVTVLATADASDVPSGCTPGYNYFQATFDNAHDVGAPITTGNFPYWWSTQRLAYVVTNASTAVSRPLRAAVDHVLGKIMRTVDAWAIVAGTMTSPTQGTVGPLVVGGAMGTQSIGAIPFTISM